MLSTPTCFKHQLFSLHTKHIRSSHFCLFLPQSGLAVHQSTNLPPKLNYKKETWQRGFFFDQRGGYI